MDSPRICFKMKKYFEEGPTYMDGMRKAIDTMHQEHGVEKWYLDIAHDIIEDDSLLAKNPQPMNEILKTLEQIETWFCRKVREINKASKKK